MKYIITDHDRMELAVFDAQLNNHDVCWLDEDDAWVHLHIMCKLKTKGM